MASGAALAAQSGVFDGRSWSHGDEGSGTMLTAIPTRWFSWDCTLQGPNGEEVGRVLLSSWREGGSLVVDGVPYAIGRDGGRSRFVMESPDGAQVAGAVKPSAWRRQFVVTHGEQRYVLKAISSFRRQLGLFAEGERSVGQITPESSFSRRARVELSDEVPRPLQAFVVWLALLLWKRDADVAALAAAGS
jgi:hypothetical protein